MLSRGTSSHTKADFAEEIEGMGARFDSDVTREKTAFTM